jgi:predicted amidohydrolase YtcJ
MRRRNLLVRAVAFLVFLVACTGEVTSTTSSEIATTSTTTAGAEPTTAAVPTTTSPMPVVPADLVLHSGQVVTVDDVFTIAEAVAITGGDIVAVGTSDELRAYAGSETTVVDLGGKSVLPGFVDPHTHRIHHLAYLSDLELLKEAQTGLLAGGTTTTGVPSVDPHDLEMFRAMEDAGDLILRNHLYLRYNNACGEIEPDEFYLQHEFSQDPDLRQPISGVKVFSDGGICNASALSVEYPDTVPEHLKDRFTGHGDLYVDSEEVAGIVAAVDAAGGNTVIHAIGDEANRVALDGVSQAYDEKPFTNRQRIDHNSLTTLLSDEELAIYGEVDMVPVVFGVPYSNGCDPAQTEAFGAIFPPSVFAVIENSAALRAANPGMKVAWHGDGPTIAGDPLQQMFTLVSGGAVDLDAWSVCYPEAWSGFHTVSVEEGIRMMTINAATAMGIEQRVGSIEVGKVADLIILEDDPLDPDLELAIGLNRPVATLINGEVHFCEGDLCSQFPSSGQVEKEPDDPPDNGLTVVASNSTPGQEPEKAFDGLADGDSFWSSGTDAPGWIEATFKTSTVAAIRLVVFQNPEGDTVHTLDLLVDGEWTEMVTFSGFTTTGDLLEWTPEDPVEGVEGVRVTTTESVSWPEWYEIEVEFD